MSLALLFHYLMLNMFRTVNIHPQELATYLFSYFMCCIALVRCVLVLRCGSAGVVWCGIRILLYFSNKYTIYINNLMFIGLCIILIVA